MKTKQIMIIAAVAVLAAVGGFYGGMTYQKSQRTNVSFNGQRNFNRQGQGFNGTNRMMGMMGERPVSGEISAVDGNTLTLKLNDGSSKIVIYSDSTKINKTSEAGKTDLKVGEKVLAIGTQGSDGTMTAQTLSLGGNFFMGGNAPAPSAN